MPTFVNQAHFVQAVEYVNREFLSKPYSLTAMCDRWFNQLALIEIGKKKKVVSLTRQHMEIILDGKKVSEEELDLVFRFYSKSAAPVTEADTADKEKATKLYTDIVERGQLQISSFFKPYITNIVQRPNHGLTHSVRAAYYITTLEKFFEDCGQFSFGNKELEQLQLMMLFSVVGRKDETGFADLNSKTGMSGKTIYRGFRATSGLEYLKYCKQYARHLYTDQNMEELYLDSLAVELMGFTKIEDAMTNFNEFIPETLLEYVIYSNKASSRDDAIAYVKNNPQFYKKLNVQGGNEKLRMMNKAHALDLSRCYQLFPQQDKKPGLINDLRNHLTDTGFLQTQSLQSLERFYQLIRSSFDAFELTGEKTNFGFISQSQFDSKKKEILKDIVDYRKILSELSLDELNSQFEKVKEKNRDKNLSYNDSSQKINYVLVNYIVEKLEAPALNYSHRVFDFQTMNANDHHQTAVHLVNSLQSIKPYPALIDNQFANIPFVRPVEQDRPDGKVELHFDTRFDLEKFDQNYRQLFNEKPNYPNDLKSAPFKVTIDEVRYKQLLQERLLQFSLVLIPKKVSQEKTLVNQEGEIEALSLINRGQAVGRLVSTTALNEEDFPDYNYLFDALEDPVHKRYTPNKKAKERRDRVADPRTAEVHQRTIKENVPARFQEPETKPIPFLEKLRRGWTVGTGGGEKNTIFIKKLAHTILPTHGRIKHFEGYVQQRVNYFPIGVLSDITQVDVKDNRYTWAQNMATQKRFWLQDSPVEQTNRVYQFLNGIKKPIDHKLDAKSTEQSLHLNLESLAEMIAPFRQSEDALLEFLESRVKQFKQLMDEKHWRPKDELIDEFSNLLADIPHPKIRFS